MKIRVMDDVFKDDMRLYMEHIWVDHHLCPAERKYIALAYIAYGSGKVIIGNETFDAAAKDIFVVLPGIKAEFISKNMSAENYDLEIHYIFFEKGFLRGEWERYGEEFSDLERFFDGTGQYYIKAADNEMSEIRNYIVRMTNEYYEYAPGRESALFGQLLSILPIVFRHHNVKEERLFSRNMLVDQTIRQIRHTIYSNPKPGEIAAHRFVTTDHLGTDTGFDEADLTALKKGAGTQIGSDFTDTAARTLSFDVEAGHTYSIHTYNSASYITEMYYESEGITPQPTDTPSEQPSDAPTDTPSEQPSAEPTDTPSEQPTADPTDAPTGQPTAEPADTYPVTLDLSVDGDGRLSVTLEYSGESGLETAVLAAAVYDGGILSGIELFEADREGEIDLNGYTVDTEKELKLFVWDSSDGMKPLSRVYTMDTEIV